MYSRPAAWMLGSAAAKCTCTFRVHVCGDFEPLGRCECGNGHELPHASDHGCVATHHVDGGRVDQLAVCSVPGESLAEPDQHAGRRRRSARAAPGVRERILHIR